MTMSVIDTGPREDRHGKIVFMVRSGGYVMCKRPRAGPFVVTEKEWARMPRLGDPTAAEYAKAVRDIASMKDRP
jgi:hypothetical protein